MTMQEAKGAASPGCKGSPCLRPYQLEALEKIEEARVQRKRVLVVSPTGSGKTVIAAEFMARAKALGLKTLFVAHRREIINQTYNKLLDAGFAATELSVVMANDPRQRPTARVHVASIDTLRHRSKPAADIVIVDEAHRALAASYRAISAKYPDAFEVGLTATPGRADGKPFREAYDELVLVTKPSTLMEEGYLVEPKCFSVPKNRLPNLRKVRMRGNDFHEGDLSKAMNRPELVGDIIEHWKKRAEGRRTVAFAVDIAHSMQIAERFNKAGIRAEHLDGSTPKEERDAILARLERGETSVVSNCNVLAEGWDQPAVKCAILARPTASSTLYLQQAGRILRPWTDPATGEKPGALLLDHAACVAMHRLPQDEREYSLDAEDPKEKLELSSAEPRRCPACECVVAARVGICPHCGFEMKVEPGPPAETDEELVEVQRETPEERAEKLAEWRRLLEVQTLSGYKRGWAQHRYREKFNEAPPRVASNGKTPEAKAAFLDEMRSICARRNYHAAYAATRYREQFGEAPPLGWDAPLFAAANDNAMGRAPVAANDWFL